MNHWDLSPGEAVMLAPVKRNGHVFDRVQLPAQFTARDTLHARFLINGSACWFELADDGGLTKSADAPFAHLVGSWRIVTPRVDTRTLGEDPPPQRPNRREGVNPKNENWRRLMEE